MTKNEIRENFKRNLNKYMIVNGFNQVDMAKALGVSSATTSDWCTGKKIPKMDNVEEIANWLGVTTSDLLASAEEHYYLSKETREMAEEIGKDKELALLFKAARDVSSEDLKTVHELLKALKRKENHEDD